MKKSSGALQLSAWVRKAGLLVGDEALDLLAGLATMVIVERAYGQAGFGIYSYFLSVFILSRYFAGFGVPAFVERELALLDDKPGRQQHVMDRGLQAVVVMGVLAAALFYLSSRFDTESTQIQEMALAYPVVGLAVLFHNLNLLRASALHGCGRHEDASRLLTKKKIFFLVSVLVLSVMQVKPSYLVIAFLAGEVLATAVSRKSFRLPPLRGSARDLRGVFDTLREGQRGLFTEDALGFILFVDFLVLGIFVPSTELGAYAEATLIGRLFFLLPKGLKPLLRRKYSSLLAVGDRRGISLHMSCVAKGLFLIHCIVATYFFLYFPGLMSFLFHQTEGIRQPYLIFSVVAAGFLLFSSVSAVEPVYAVLGRLERLRKQVVLVLAANLVLNLYLVPYAGFFGAAAATTVSMFLYFLFFGSGLGEEFRAFKWQMAAAGGVVYLVYVMFKEADVNALFAVPLLPVMVCTLLWVTGFFVQGEEAA